MTNFYVHIGMAKAASSYLQKYIFPRVKGIDFFGPSDEVAQDLHDNIISGMPYISPFCIASNEETKNNILISHEGLCVLKASDGADIAMHLVDAFCGNLKVILLLREQRSWLYSRYNQDFKAHMDPHVGYFDFKSWVAGALHESLAKNGNAYAMLYHPMKRINYALLLQSYEKFIQKDNILVLPYEMLKIRPDAFINKILGFLGSVDTGNSRECFTAKKGKTVNASINDVHMRIHKGLSYTIGKALTKRIDPLVAMLTANRSAKTSIAREISSDDKNEIRKINRYVDKHYHLGLEEYGYIL